MIDTGSLDEYRQAVIDELGNDVEKLQRALAAAWRGREHLQNRLSLARQIADRQKTSRDHFIKQCNAQESEIERLTTEVSELKSLLLYASEWNWNDADIEEQIDSDKLDRITELTNPVSGRQDD